MGIIIASLYVVNFMPNETIVNIGNETFEGENLKGFNAGNFYCVKVDNEFNYNVAKYEDHEMCHTLVNSDYKHFCKD